LEKLKGGDHLEDLGDTWKVNIRMDLREKVWEDEDWIHLRPVVGCCEGGNEPLGSIKGGERLDGLSEYVELN
jgi:hypothetical protein